MSTRFFVIAISAATSAAVAVASLQIIGSEGSAAVAAAVGTTIGMLLPFPRKAKVPKHS